jgi:alpha-pyrone synthase
MKTVYINQIECRVPEYEGHEKSVEFLAGFVPEENKPKFLAIAKRLGIEKRYTVLKAFFGDNGHSFYHAGRFPTTAERMEAYQEHAFPLVEKTLNPLLKGCDRQAITHLIVTSCTGFYAPGVDVEIVKRLGLRSSVERTLIGYMGCYASIPGLKLAQKIVQADPEAKVLMVNLELCTLHWRKGDIPFDQFISFLLFADGCAASLISAESTGLKLENFYSTLLPDTMDFMGWTIGDDGFFMHLDAGLSKKLAEGLNAERTGVMKDRNVEDYAYWAVHPGGRSILDGIKQEMKIQDFAITDSYHVLRNYGNMSSATLMFILEKIMRDSTRKGRGCALAFGPGLALESFTFEKE